MSCTSTCRAPSRYGSQKTVPSPKADAASRRACATASASRARSRTTRMPRPPPPADALTSTGNRSTASGSTVDSTGTPASATVCLAATLEPIAATAFAGGPTQVSPASDTAAANCAFSDRKPYPGCTASAPARSAAAITRSPRRYVSAGAAPGSRADRSASRTCGASASGSAYTATVSMPSARQVAKTRRAISPRLATSSRRIITPSHPEDAEALGALDRSTVDGGQRDAQDGTGVPRVDHAVVVQAAGQEQGRRLGVDLLLDHRP